MTKTLEQRVTDLEDLIADLPQLLNLRLDAIQAGQQEQSARLGLVDKQAGIIVRDLRDLRGGVTNQLRAQDALLQTITEKLDALATRLP